MQSSSLYILVYVCIYTFLSIHKVCIYVYMYMIYIYICTYVYVCIYIYIYIHIYIYMCYTSSCTRHGSSKTASSGGVAYQRLGRGPSDQVCCIALREPVSQSGRLKQICTLRVPPSSNFISFSSSDSHILLPFSPLLG